MPSGAVTIGPWIEGDYRAPCPPGTDVLNGNATFDVHVVSTTLLSGAGAPASMPKTALWISGVVFERTSEGVRPIAGATVDLANDDPERRVISTTLTDAARVPALHRSSRDRDRPDHVGASPPGSVWAGQPVGPSGKELQRP